MKIAMLGVENSHADEFGKLIAEKPEKYGDIEVVGVYSEDEEATKRLIDKGYTNYAAKTPDEFLGKVDAVIVVARHGDNHYKYAMPYVKAGIPCFIDKPFCANLDNAKELAQTAKTNGALLCGGSCVKFFDETKHLTRLAKQNRVVGGMVATPINIDNPYGGFWFYTQHLVEMMTTIFGRNVKSVIANCPDEKLRRVTVIFNYGDFDVCGIYSPSNKFYANVMFENSTLAEGYCDNVLYTFERELDMFVDMVKNGVMLESYDELVYPVKVLDAIHRSYTEKKEIVIE